MQVLKEKKKDELPLSFLTDFVSRGWDQIGQLKETIAAIKGEFSGTKKVEDILQPLVDAYLVCVGQLELHMQNKDYIELPKTDATEDLKEELVIKETAEEVKMPNEQVDIEKEVKVGDAVITQAPQFKKPVAVKEEVTVEAENPAETVKEPADFFCDFDEPEGRPVTDKDLYPDESKAL